MIISETDTIVVKYGRNKYGVKVIDEINDYFNPEVFGRLDFWVLFLIGTVIIGIFTRYAYSLLKVWLWSRNFSNLG